MCERENKIYHFSLDCFTKQQTNINVLSIGNQVRHGKDQEFDWGIIINFKKMTDGPKGKSTSLVIDCLLHVEDSADEEPRPVEPGHTGRVEVVPIVQTLIMQLSSLRLYFPKDLRPADNRKSVLKSIGEVCLFQYF